MRRLQQQQQEQYANFQNLAATAFEGILIHHHGKILASNQALERLTGYTQAELLNMDVMDLLPLESHDLARTYLAQPPDQPYEIIGQKKNGQRVGHGHLRRPGE